MGSLKVYATLAGFIAAATSITTAHAADLLPPPPPMPEAPPAYADVAGGWYLRGDVGVSRYQGGKTSVQGATTEFYDNDFGSGAFAGAGVGYQVSSWFRADVTGEYRFSTGFKWNDKGPVGTSTFFYNPGTNRYDTYTASGTSYEKTSSDFSSAVVLLNGYADLGTWHGFTLFVGGGVGYAYHYLHNGSTSTLNAYGNYAGSTGGPPADVSGGSIRNKDHGDFAWALHAGVAYDVTQNVKLEVAYRYLNLGDVKTGTINCYCGQTYTGLRTRELESHDVKIGMRWALGDAAPAPVYEPAPLIRKY